MLKRLLTFVFLFALFSSPAFAVSPAILAGNMGGGGACNVDCTDSSLCEAWDGDTCAVEGWTVSGTANCATAAVGCGGSYEAVVTNGGAEASIYKGFTENSEIFVKFDFRFSANFAGNDYLTRLYDVSAGSACMSIYIRNDESDVMRAYHGAVNAAGSTALAPDTWYTLKYRYLADPGGSTGQGWVWLAAGQQQTFDTTCTANCEVKITTGTDTDVSDRLYLYSSDDASTSNFIYDNIWVGTTDPDA